MLRDGNGIEICKEPKSDNRFKLIPVILMSAPAGALQLAESCADAYIEKPFDIVAFRPRYNCCLPETFIKLYCGACKEIIDSVPEYTDIKWFTNKTVGPVCFIKKQMLRRHHQHRYMLKLRIAPYKRTKVIPLPSGNILSSKNKCAVCIT